jgi:hypothetical protein
MRFGGRRRGAVTAVAVERLRLDAETRDQRPVTSGRMGGGRRGAPRPVSVRPAAGSLGWSAACRRPAQAVRQAARSRLDLPTWSPPWTAGPQTNTPTPLQQIGEHRAPPLKIHSMSIVSSWIQSTITSSLSSIEQLPQCQSKLNRKLEKLCNLLYVFCNFALYHEPF